MATRIDGTVSRVNWYADGTPALEIHVPRNRAEGLPFREGDPVQIKLKFAGNEYDAVLLSTKRNPYVWVSPTLQSVNGTRTTLGRVLTEGGLRPNDRLILVVEAQSVSVETPQTVDVRHALSSEQQSSGDRETVIPRIHSPTSSPMTIDFDAFQEMEFPQYRNIVYVFFYVRGEGTERVPFYVGESSRHVGRFGDYVSANFSASTDFKVGEAVKYLRERGLRVIIKFRESRDRKDEQNRILQDLRGTFQLLNDLTGYDYKIGDADGERLKIQQFIDRILENPHRREARNQ